MRHGGTAVILPRAGALHGWAWMRAMPRRAQPKLIDALELCVAITGASGLNRACAACSKRLNTQTRQEHGVGDVLDEAPGLLR